MFQTVNIADRLRQALKSRGLRQRELARKLGVVEATVSHYLSGKRTPGLVELEAIARILEMPPAELIGWNDRFEVAARELLAVHESIPRDIETWRRRALAAEQKLATLQAQLKAALLASEASSPPAKPAKRPSRRRARLAK